MALQDCNDGLRHQCHELLFPLGLHHWARTVVLVVVVEVGVVAVSTCAKAIIDGPRPTGTTARHARARTIVRPVRVRARLVAMTPE